ncbi:MAG: U32 family peptidase [Hyphomicrobiaceae bacterium]|nr:U32 family peptidase [Hyphomicrobiaceae bacterium]
MLEARETGAVSLTLGPVLFNWPTPMWTDFYARIADEAPVDRVVIGEVVCSKRSPFRMDVISDVVERLERAGKEVAISALALPTLKREIAEVAGLAGCGHLVEINDVTALAAIAGTPHLVGPLVNVYNEETLAELESLGSVTVSLSPELPLSSIAILGAARRKADLEIFAFGRAPLAISARCYHARAHGLPKDGCKYVCEQDLDGLEVETLDGQSFLAVNGVQTLGSGVTVLGQEISQLHAMGVSRLRLSPHTCDMVAVANAYHDLLDGRLAWSELASTIEALNLPAGIVNGYLHGKSGAVNVS